MFYLSEETPFQIETEAGAPLIAPGAPAWVFFQTSVHTPVCRIALVLLAGSKAVFEPFRILGDERGLLTVGQALPGISRDGLVAKLYFRHNSGKTLLASVSIPKECGAAPWTEVEFSLKPVAGSEGSIVIECDPGPDNDSTADWLAVYECVVSPPWQFRLNRARAFQAWRTRNELQHMSRVYTEGDFYESEHSFPPYQRTEPTEERINQLRQISANSFDMANLFVQDLIGPPALPFHARLATKAHYASRPLRVLSLCSGEARVEAEMIQRSGVRNLNVTLMDVNAQLLERARRKFSQLCKCDTITMDVNAMDLEPGAYDLIVCVSGLHHLIELEHVTRSMARGLAPGGEFWSIGEYVGRNGARLWPEAYTVANKLFRQLPEQYRRNWTPGTDGKPDSMLPDIDCSVSTFESIRSEDLEGCLERAFIPLNLARHDCLLWRFFDPAYERNYDIQDSAALAMMQRVVELEVAHRMNGGRPTALNAIYRAR
jgi:ubiquinone/menaquinone biosynthesis C-methylase UbiE